MAIYEACKFLVHGGKCSHQEAPEPNKSDCIGKDACGSWEDEISYKAKTPRAQKLRECFEHIGNIQSELVLSPELCSEHDDPNIIAVYNKLEEARELMRKV